MIPGAKTVKFGIMSIRSWFMARFYDATMKKAEATCFGQWRQELLADASGRVLEIGSGTGVNIPHYPDTAEELVLTEPDPHMLRLLQEKLGTRTDERISVYPCSADALDFPDDTFDVVVTTLVLCSVPSPVNTFQEIRRVLKPGGTLIFMEHVIARDNPGLVKWQKFFQPVWCYMCGNCHLTRDMEKSLQDAGFRLEQIDRLMAPGSPPVVAPTIKGIAVNR